MKVRFFRIPLDGGPLEDELNRLLATERVRDVEKHLVTDGGTSYWAVAVTLLTSDPISRVAVPTKDAVDYRAVLTDEEFAVYSKLRELRKQMGLDLGMNGYLIVTNQQMADIVQQRITTAAQLAKLRGFGDARATKFGPLLIKFLEREIPALPPKADAP